MNGAISLLDCVALTCLDENEKSPEKVDFTISDSCKFSIGVLGNRFGTKATANGAPVLSLRHWLFCFIAATPAIALALEAL